MSSDAGEIQRRYREFLDLLPLTLALAGLPCSEGRLYNEEQIKARMFTLRHAYRASRQLAREIVHGGTPGQNS